MIAMSIRKSCCG